MNLHRQPKLIQQRVAGWAGKKLPVEYTLEPEILGTGGGIRNAREFLKDGTFVTANSDTIVRFPFAAALAFHRKKRALATLVLFPDPENRYTPVRLDADDRIAGFGRESIGGGSGFYTGFQIVEPELLGEIPPGRSCIVNETYRRLAGSGAPVFGFLSSGYFREFGTPSDYLRGTLALLAENPGGNADPSPVSSEFTIDPPAFISPKAKIAAGARIGPEAVIEDGAVVKEGASVTRAIIWPDAVLGAGENISRAILTPQRRIDIP